MSRNHCLSLLLLCACHHSETNAVEVPEVTVERASISTLIHETPISGVLTPLPGRDIKIGALVAGRVDQVLVAEGDVVKAGQLLAHVEAQPLRDRLLEADAQKEQSQAALTNARLRLQRAEKLWKDGISARQEVDDAQAEVAAALSSSKKAQASNTTANTQLDRASLRAPFAGTIAAILVPAGQPVDGSGTPVIEVADTTVLNVRAPLSAALVGAVRVGQAALLNVDGVGQARGEVEAIAPLVDSATNTVIVRVRVDNRDARLRGGLFARGVLLGEARQVLTIAEHALLPGQSAAADVVAILDDANVVGRVTVVTGEHAGGRVEIKSGLASGTRVISDGAYTLPVGTKVSVRP